MCIYETVRGEFSTHPVNSPVWTNSAGKDKIFRSSAPLVASADTSQEKKNNVPVLRDWGRKWGGSCGATSGKGTRWVAFSRTAGIIALVFLGWTGTMSVPASGLSVQEHRGVAVRATSSGWSIEDSG